MFVAFECWMQRATLERATTSRASSLNIQFECSMEWIVQVSNYLNLLWASLDLPFAKLTHFLSYRMGCETFQEWKGWGGGRGGEVVELKCDFHHRPGAAAQSSSTSTFTKNETRKIVLYSSAHFGTIPMPIENAAAIVLLCWRIGKFCKMAQSLFDRVRTLITIVFN